LPLYTQAVANTRLVGLELAYLIQKLRDEHGLRPEDVHLIGHSLGAHLSSYAGMLYFAIILHFKNIIES
jgi:pancreatic triacylglycerol lipase